MSNDGAIGIASREGKERKALQCFVTGKLKLRALQNMNVFLHCLHGKTFEITVLLPQMLIFKLEKPSKTH